LSKHRSDVNKLAKTSLPIDVSPRNIDGHDRPGIKHVDDNFH